MPTSFSPTTLGNVSYTYDPAGHVITRGGTLFQSVQAGAITAAAYSNGNRLISQTAAGATVTPSWDGNGNLVCDNYNASTATCTGRTFTWDSRNRLTGISPAGTDTSFTYDMFNRRLSKGGSGGVTTQYVYDGWNEVQEQNSKGAVSANMLNGLGLDDRFTRTVIASGTTSAFLVDGLGSTLGLAYTGAVKTDYAYQPYGTASVSGTSNTNTYEYTGRELDGSGLQYNRNRYYNPAWGRFVSEDPIGFAGGINVYAYVGNNPTSLRDPRGNGPVGAAIGGWLGGDLGAATGGLGGGAVGSLAGPIGTGVGADLGASVGGYAGSKLGSALGSAIEDAISNTLAGLGNTASSCPDPSSAQQPDRNGLTKGGRSLQKHSSRPGSNWQKPDDTTANGYNQAAQKIINEMLNNPDSAFSSNPGGGTDVTTPDGNAIRFDANGNFQFFR